MKKNNLFRSVFILSIFILFFTACTSSNEIKRLDTKKFKAEMTDEIYVLKTELGKKLFFDPVLSKDGTVSCASCHKPSHGFSDTTPVSLGINGQKGGRNTPTVYTASNISLLFWDGRAPGLEEQALGPIENPIEMGEKLENVLKKLNAHKYYSEEFKKVYMISPITKEQLADAISEFERSIVSEDSNYDRFLRGNVRALSPSAKRGLELFRGKAMCAACHKGPDFTDGDFHNIGLPITEDSGREKITKKKEDTRKFKTPTLREIENTAPYFHTGEFETLEAVLAFYNAGGGEDKFKDILKVPLNLTIEEQKDIVEFLKSLTGRQAPVTPPELPK